VASGDRLVLVIAQDFECMIDAKGPVFDKGVDRFQAGDLVGIAEGWKLSGEDDAQHREGSDDDRTGPTVGSPRRRRGGHAKL
jgi:hypothetical protein